MANRCAMRLLIAGVLALAALTGCSPAAIHRLWVASQAAKYIQSHGGDYSAYHVYTMPAGSMLPTIRIGSSFLVYQSAYRSQSPQRGDIAIVNGTVMNLPLVKRVIALPGDRFAMQGGTVYVNGRRIAEPYIKERADYGMAVRDYGIYVQEPGGRYDALDAQVASVPKRARWTAPDRLPPGCYFVFGDNRNDSEDSHVFGCATRSSFAGKVVTIF